VWILHHPINIFERGRFLCIIHHFITFCITIFRILSHLAYLLMAVLMAVLRDGDGPVKNKKKKERREKRYTQV